MRRRPKPPLRTIGTFTRSLFTRREHDADAGLQYHRARWYDAENGSWISEDPLGFAAGDVNLARYVGNRPSFAADPSGLIDGNYTPPGMLGRPNAPTESQKILAPDTPGDVIPVAGGYIESEILDAMVVLVASTLIEPIDWAFTAVDIYDEPLNAWNYVGLLPFFSNKLGDVGEGLLKHPPGMHLKPDLGAPPKGGYDPLLPHVTAPKGVGDTLKGLPGKSGKTGPIKEVPDAKALDDLFDSLSSGGKTVNSGTYSGVVKELPDGTIIRRRPGSKSGGATLDITLPDGKIVKVHIEQ